MASSPAPAPASTPTATEATTDAAAPATSSPTSTPVGGSASTANVNEANTPAPAVAAAAASPPPSSSSSSSSSSPSSSPSPSSSSSSPSSSPSAAVAARPATFVYRKRGGDPPPRMRVGVAWHKRVSVASGEYYLYEVTVKSAGGEHIVTLFKLFDSFKNLYSMCKKNHAAILASPGAPFFPLDAPVSTVPTFGAQKLKDVSEAVVQQRTEQLATWLQWFVDVPGVLQTWFPLEIFLCLPDLSGRVCIVTGATGGVGRATAVNLSSLGASVIVAGRNELNAQAVVAHIKEVTRNENVAYMQLDLGDLNSIRQFAQRFQTLNMPVHMLVANAGAKRYEHAEMTRDGFEYQFGVNYLGHFMLTRLLWDELERGEGRVVNLIDRSYADVKSFFVLQHARRSAATAPNGEPVVALYHQSKVALVMYTLFLARRAAAAGSRVTVVASAPSECDTALERDNAGLRGMFDFVRAVAFKDSAEVGAVGPTYTAISPHLNHLSGHLFAEMAEVRPSALASLDGLQEELWNASFDWTDPACASARLNSSVFKRTVEKKEG